MAQIALPRAEYEKQCTVNTCHDGNGGYSHRNQFCNGTQIEWMAYCAITTRASATEHLAMWADGGTAADIPNPRAIHHSWPDNGAVSIFLLSTWRTLEMSLRGTLAKLTTDFAGP